MDLAEVKLRDQWRKISEDDRRVLGPALVEYFRTNNDILALYTKVPNGEVSTIDYICNKELT